MEDANHLVDTSSRVQLEEFLHGLAEFKTPVETISELAKHEKVDGRGSWTLAEMENELLYGIQLYLTHIGCPLEYTIPCARAVVNDVLDGSFRAEDYEAPPPQLARIEGSNGEEWGDSGENGHHGGPNDLIGEGEEVNGDGIHKEKGKVLSAKNLYQHAIVKANELLSRWKDVIPTIEPVPLPHALSIYAMKNKRTGMEDRHVVIPDLRAVVDVKGIKSPISFYAVYDGHAGAVAATYAAAHLHRRLCSSKNFPEHMEEALKEAFLSTDDLYNVKGERDRDNSGTTAVVSIIYEKKLYIAWVGDSEAAIVQNGQAERLVEPRHTAENEGERTRVEKEGGTVIHHQGGWRVAAVLTVTRAIGDSGLKPFVTASPDVKSIDLVGSEDYLIIACDGLWDEMTPESAMMETNAYLLKNPDRVKDVAKALADRAKKSGSMDNITVLVVFLKPIQQLLEELRSRSANLLDVSNDGTDKLNSFANPSGSREDEFADLVDSTDFPVEFDPTARNPFDTTPLDSSVLGDFGTPLDRGASEVDWDFERVPLPLNFNEEEFNALNVLDQVIDGAGKLDLSPAVNDQLINFDSPSETCVAPGFSGSGINENYFNKPDSSSNGVAISEPNSGSNPTPPVVSTTPGKKNINSPASTATKTPKSTEGKGKATPPANNKDTPAASPSKPKATPRPAAEVTTPTAKPSLSSTKTVPADVKPSPISSKTAPADTKPSTTSTKPDVKPSPQPSARKPATTTTTPVQKVEPKPTTTSDTKAKEVPKTKPVPSSSSAPPKIPRTATTKPAAANLAGTAAATKPLASATPPTKTASPLAKSTPPMKDAAPQTPEIVADAADKSKQSPLATPRTTPAVKKAAVPPVKLATTKPEKAVESTVEGAKTTVKTNGTTPSTSRPADAKKTGAASARTATPAVKSARPVPAATLTGPTKSTTARGVKPASESSTNVETPKSKPIVAEMKTPMVPPARPKTDVPVKSSVGTPRPPKPAAESLTPKTPRSATEAVSKTFTKPSPAPTNVDRKATATTTTQSKTSAATKVAAKKTVDKSKTVAAPKNPEQKTEDVNAVQKPETASSVSTEVSINGVPPLLSNGMPEQKNVADLLSMD